MTTAASLRFCAAALALALLPMAAGAQGLPTGKRQHKPVSVPAQPVSVPAQPVSIPAQPTTAPEAAYQLDAEAGEIRFGDGEHGRRPASGGSAENAPRYRKSAPVEGSAPAGKAPTQHGESDLDFLKERARKSGD